MQTCNFYLLLQFVSSTNNMLHDTAKTEYRNIDGNVSWPFVIVFVERLSVLSDVSINANNQKIKKQNVPFVYLQINEYNAIVCHALWRWHGVGVCSGVSGQWLSALCLAFTRTIGHSCLPLYSHTIHQQISRTAFPCIDQPPMFQ